MQYFLVVNPVSGRGKAPQMARRLNALLCADGHQVHTLHTSRDVLQFRQDCEAITEHDRVVCFGGDGTLLYFLNHALHFRDVAFFGMGTANVISIEFNIPREMKHFSEMLLAGKFRRIRPGLHNGSTRFLMMASFGLDAFILSNVSQRLKNRVGKLAFLPTALTSLLRYRYPRISLTLDQQTRLDVAAAIICRFKHYGGAFRLAPLADPCQDAFQIIVIKEAGLFSLLQAVWQFWRGDPQQGLMAKHVAITGVAPCQLDGDYYPEPCTTLEVSPHSFSLLVP